MSCSITAAMFLPSLYVGKTSETSTTDRQQRRDDESSRRTCLQRKCVEHMPLDPSLTHWVSRALFMILFIAHTNALTHWDTLG